MRVHTLYASVSGNYGEVEAIGAAALFVPSGKIILLSGPVAPILGGRLTGTRLAAIVLALESIPEGDTVTVFSPCTYVLAAVNQQIDRPEVNVAILRRLRDLIRTRPTLGRDPQDDPIALSYLHHTRALAEMARIHQNGEPIPPLEEPSRQMDLFS